MCVAIAMVGTGCLSLQEQIEHQEQLVMSGQYERAYTQTAGWADDAGLDGADTNFWNADAGTLALMAGRPQQAVAHLEVADNGFNDEARRVYGSSAMDTVAEVLVSDCVTAYAPEGVDRVFVNLYKAFAYGVQGNLSGLRVELNRARERQFEWFYTCATDLQEQQEELKSLSKEERELAVSALSNAEQKQLVRLDAAAMSAIVSESASSADRFAYLKGFGNAYAAHLAGITRWCAGDSSRNDLAMAHALAPANSYVTQDHALAKSGQAPTNRVWVYIEDGLAPRRVSNQVVLPYVAGGSTAGLRTITFDMPKLKDRTLGSSSYTVNGQPVELLLNVDGLVHDQFDRLWAGILTRQIARTVVRVAAQEALYRVAESQTDNGLVFLAMSILFAGYDVATNVADLRCADLLPKNVWMASIERPANGVVTLKTAEGQQLQIPLQSKGNTLLWVRKPSIVAAPTVLVVDLGQP